MKSNPNENFLKLIGAKVRSIRVEKKITMETMAFESGIEYRQIGRIERGEVNTTVMSLFRIAEVLNTDVHHFFLFS